MALAVAVGACAPSSPGAASDVGATSGGNGSSGSGGQPFDFDAGNDLPDPDAACALVTEKGNAIPLNLYIMFDKSSSMAGDKWQSATDGLLAFVHEPDFEDVRAALGFFPRPADEVPACDQEAYATPRVPFDSLGDNADAIQSALEGESPDGFSTPIYPALGGAILASIDVATDRPGEAAAVLLVTDGAPQGPAPQCAGVDPEDPEAIADLATAGIEFDPSIATYVIGLPGVDQAIANRIAEAGGTDSAVLVGANDVEGEFRDALRKITGDALSCEFEVPSKVQGGEVSWTNVNVLLAEGENEPALLPQNPDCDGPGWRYDEPSHPTRIFLCPATCSSVKAETEAGIQILLGCATVIE